MTISGVSQECSQWICPDLTGQWQLGQIPESERVVLCAIQGQRQILLSPLEGYALRYFTGRFTVAQVQHFCEQEFGDLVAPEFVGDLLQSLITKQVVADSSQESPGSQESTVRLKAGVHWIEHPGGYWILRNPHEVTFLQVSPRDQQLIEHLTYCSPTEVAQRFEVSPQTLQRLLQLLASTGMLEGTVPAKPPRRQKFNPLHLLLMRIPLFNPDVWLGRQVDKLRWIWTSPLAGILTVLLVASAVVGVNQTSQIVSTGQKLWTTQGAWILLPFILLCGLVVALHELAHAFTLKHYGGIVPEIGLLILGLMPGCYTNTTDAYALTKRQQRVLVVGAGVLCQLILWAVGLWLWLSLTPGTWLHTTSYLLMAAALLTVAVNLNPLAKFDGYYLAVAATGINNLRSRSFWFYFNLLTGRPIRERGRDRLIFALYAPFSLLYTLLVFGHLLVWLLEWCLTHIPALALGLLLLWILYRFLPTFSSQASTMTSANSVQPHPRSSVQAGAPQAPPPPRSQSSSQSIAHPQSESSHPTPNAIDPPQAQHSHSASSVTTPTSSIRVPKRLLILGALTLAVGAIGMIPMSDTVTGEATIQSTPGQRQVVTMGRSARINAMYVRQNDQVRVGQLLAELSSDELQQQGIEVERKLAEARAERETARQALHVALEKGTGAQIKTQNQVLRATQLQNELGQLAAGQAPPRIRQLQSQQAEKQSQIRGITAQLAIVEDQLNRYQGLVQEGALPLAKVDELRREAIALQTQQAGLGAQVETLNQQIATAHKEMQDDWMQRRQPEVAEAQAMVAVSQQETAAATATLQKWERQIPLLEAEQQHLQRQQAGLKVRATVAGVVTTPDLDVLEGQKLPEGKEVLTIAQVTQPTVILELPQSEAQRIKVGMPVTVRLQDQGLTGYQAKVQEIPPITAPENPQQPQQKAIVKVRVQLQEQPTVALGTKGYAHVQLGQVPLYQKVQRELLKLFPVGRFL